MTDLEKLCEVIDKYETEQLNDGWNIHYYKLWEGVKFIEIIDGIRQMGLNDHSWSTKTEIFQRIDNYATFGHDYGKETEIPSREYLHVMEDAVKAVDEELNLGLHEMAFNGQTADQIADEWEENERWEKEQEARQECIDFCANVAFNDGLCETLDEAYDIAELVC